MKQEIKYNSVLCQKQWKKDSIPYAVSSSGTLPCSWKHFMRLKYIGDRKQASAKHIISKNRSKIHKV